MCDLHVNTTLKRDPTRTTTIRKQFEAEAYKRFRRLKGRIREVVVNDDAFGPGGRFDFVRSDAKVAAFIEWLREAERQELLEVNEGIPLNRSARNAWTSLYIDSAYQRGIAQAGARMRSAGARVAPEWISAAFNRPIHADRLGLAYIRTFQELEGITAAMDQQISRVLAEGLAEGRGPLDIARRINERVDKVGITRSRVLARTEVISAHAEASLNTYEEAGIEGVEVEAEWATAGDSRVCARCAAMEGRTFTLREARGMIPLHPNCRCTFIPKIINGSGIELR